MADLKALADAVIKGNQEVAVEITKAALDEGAAPKIVLDKGLIVGTDIHMCLSVPPEFSIAHKIGCLKTRVRY